MVEGITWPVIEPVYFLARSKPLIDGLTRAEVIVDDSAQHVTYNLAGFYRAKQNETVITVKEQ